jgi:uroporphyrinogen III methyltransferase/synthase
MAAKAIPDVTKQLTDDGVAPDTPAAIVYAAGTDDEQIIRSTLSEIDQAIGNRQQATDSLPGLLLVGATTAYSYTSHGALKGDKILLTCSEALQDKASRITADLGGIPIQRPLIDLIPLNAAIDDIGNIETYDWMVVTSPSAARCFFNVASANDIDLRSVPKVLVCGTGTADEFKKRGIVPDAMPDSGFNATSVVKTIKPFIGKGDRILRLRADKAGTSLAEALSELGADVTDCVLYENKPIQYESLPDFDAVFFASASAVTSFSELWGAEALSDKIILSIGIPTAKELENIKLESDVIGDEATVESAITTLAAHYVNMGLI